MKLLIWPGFKTMPKTVPKTAEEGPRISPRQANWAHFHLKKESCDKIKIKGTFDTIKKMRVDLLLSRILVYQHINIFKGYKWYFPLEYLVCFATDAFKERISINKVREFQHCVMICQCLQHRTQTNKFPHRCLIASRHAEKKTSWMSGIVMMNLSLHIVCWKSTWTRKRASKSWMSSRSMVYPNLGLSTKIIEHVLLDEHPLPMTTKGKFVTVMTLQKWVILKHKIWGQNKLCIGVLLAPISTRRCWYCFIPRFRWIVGIVFAPV